MLGALCGIVSLGAFPAWRRRLDCVVILNSALDFFFPFIFSELFSSSRNPWSSLKSCFPSLIEFLLLSLQILVNLFQSRDSNSIRQWVLSPLSPHLFAPGTLSSSESCRLPKLKGEFHCSRAAALKNEGEFVQWILNVNLCQESRSGSTSGSRWPPAAKEDQWWGQRLYPWRQTWFHHRGYWIHPGQEIGTGQCQEHSITVSWRTWVCMWEMHWRMFSLGHWK